MEWFLSLFILHDTLVVSLLVVGITIVVVMLLLFSQKSPKSVVKSELGGTDNVESALRRVLGEQRWAQAGASNSSSGGADSQELDALQMEVLEKDRKIAELNKQLTQEGPAGEGGVSADDSELLAKLAELEARLHEYEIIEDDIADLSLYKTENEKLKNEIDALRAKIGGAAPEPAAPEDPDLKIVEPPKVEEPAPAIEEEETGGVDGADLVAEFEKVVNSQSDLAPPEEEESSRVSVEINKDPGKVLMADEFVSKKEEPLPVHSKLKDISPGSKEEAEVFINELKNLKAIQKKTGEDS